jgi:hypothetical protein
MKLAKYTTFILIFSLLFVAIPTFAQSGLPALCTGVQLQNTSNQTAYSIVMHFFMPGNDGIADYSYTVQTAWAHTPAALSISLTCTLTCRVPCRTADTL